MALKVPVLFPPTRFPKETWHRPLFRASDQTPETPIEIETAFCLYLLLFDCSIRSLLCSFMNRAACSFQIMAYAQNVSILIGML